MHNEFYIPCYFLRKASELSVDPALSNSESQILILLLFMQFIPMQFLVVLYVSIFDWLDPLLVLSPVTLNIMMKKKIETNVCLYTTNNITLYSNKQSRQRSILHWVYPFSCLSSTIKHLTGNNIINL